MAGFQPVTHVCLSPKNSAKSQDPVQEPAHSKITTADLKPAPKGSLLLDLAYRGSSVNSLLFTMSSCSHLKQHRNSVFSQIVAKSQSPDLMKPQEELVADKPMRRELSFTATCNKDRSFSPQRRLERKKPSTPFASEATIAAARPNPAVYDKKRSIEFSKLASTLQERDAVILESLLQDPSKRAEHAIKQPFTETPASWNRTL